MRNISETRMSDASDVSLTKLINVFDSGGIDTRAACGNITRRNACPDVIPNEYAASHCPFGIDKIAARIISEAYAPTFNEKPMMAAGNEGIVMPMFGRP